MAYAERMARPRVVVAERCPRGLAGFEEQQVVARGTAGRSWPAVPDGARHPLAHLRPDHVEPESVVMMSEVLKALRPFPDARGAVRARFAELFRDVQ